MKKIVTFSFVALLVMFAGCSDKQEVDPKEAPTRAMLDALQKLDAHDFDAYLACADIVGEDDSTHLDLYRQLLNQQQEFQQQSKGNVAKYDVVDVKFACDSVCTVFFQTTFADSTKEICSQKMVRINDVWKVKIRN